MSLLEQLKSNYRYRDYYIPDDRYERYLRQCYTEPLTPELVDYLCSQIDSPKNKRSCELRFIHLQPLFLNPTAKNFDLKEYLCSHISKCRRLWLKLFYIRAYAIFAAENELEPIMRKFETNLQKIHDYQDYDQILSKAGLPYLCKKYGYDCFFHALSVAEKEYLTIDPLIRGFFTLDEDGNFVDIVSSQEYQRRWDEYYKKKELG